MALNFQQAGNFNGIIGGPSVLSNPTSLQFGPDGRLYVAEQNGTINAFEVEIQEGEYVATSHEVLELPDGLGIVQGIQNHDDDGALNDGVTTRQVTGIVVAGTADNPVLYISSSDPRISTNNDVNLDTNSGIITRATLNEAGEWEVVDIVRGLPRSEENHSVNGLQLSPDGTSLFVTVGGNTNNGAPSLFFSNTTEFALSGTVLEIDLTDIESRDILTDADGGQNGTSRDFVYDLPTLDDPNRANDGVLETADGLDVNGPFGGNDGLNQAILPADAPITIFADGLRNAFDLVLTESGQLFTSDNGGNGGLGGNPIFVDGEATNQINGGGDGDPDSLFLITEGVFLGHPNPTRSNQDGSLTVFDNNGNPDGSLGENTVADLSALVPDAVDIADGFLIDPSRFDALQGLGPDAIAERLLESGTRVPRDSAESLAITNFGASTNGITEYNTNGAAFDGALDGALIVASFNGTVSLVNINADGTGLDPIIDPGNDGILGNDDDFVASASGELLIATGLAGALDVTVGPDGSIFVTELFSNTISVFTPGDAILPGDPDVDNDGLDNAVDPFSRDASNGDGVTILAGEEAVFDFDSDLDGNLQGPNGIATGLTGVAVNGETDFEEFFVSESTRPGQNIQLDNVAFATASGGGTTVIEFASNGTASGTANDGEFLFQTGVDIGLNVETFTVEWTVFNPAIGPGGGAGENTGAGFTTGANQEIGGFIGTGDQSNFLKVVATDSADNGPGFLVELENNDGIVVSNFIAATDLFTGQNVNSSTITIQLDVNIEASTATPIITYELAAGGTTTVTGDAIDLSGTNVLEAINGDFLVEGQSTNLAVGLFTTNGDASEAGAFQAIFDDVTVTADGDTTRTILERINIGGPQVAALDGGPTFEEDTVANPSEFFVDTGASPNIDGFGVTPGETVPDSTPDSIFNMARFDQMGGGQLTYAFGDLEDGLYELTVFLGNGFDGASQIGQRVFDISLEGEVPSVFDDVDPVLLFGNNTGGALSALVEVTDGTLDVVFINGIENPNPFGLELARIGTFDAPVVPIVNVENAAQIVGEDEGTAFVSITTNETVPADQSVTIDFALSSGTATAGEDFTIDVPGATLVDGVYTGQLTIGGSSSDVQLPISILQDDDIELNESFSFEITAVSDNAEIGIADAEITISNDDTPGGPVVLAINAGGPAIAADAPANTFGVDFAAAPAEGGLFTGGTNFSDGGGGNGPQPAFDGTVFETEVFGGLGDAVLTFAADLDPNTEYTVELLFAEIFQGMEGARVFDVSIEGQLILDDLDIFAANNGNIDAPFIASVPGTFTTGDNGTLDIEFDASVDNGQISGIIIREVEQPPVEFERGALLSAINVGGPALTQDGIDFEANDAGEAPFAGTQTFNNTQGGGNGVQPGLNGTVFATERNGAPDGDFTLTLDLGAPSEQVFVDLYLAELFQTAAGARTFNVVVEGELILENVDILAMQLASGLTQEQAEGEGIVISLPGPIDLGPNGTLDIVFDGQVDRAAITGITVFEAVIAIPDAPELVTEIADQLAPEDAPFTLDVSDTFAETEGDAITLTAEIVPADGGAPQPLPAWLSFDAETGIFSGTPLQSDIGDLEIVVTATDNDGSTSDTFAISITNVNDAPEAIGEVANQTAIVDAPFSLALPSTDTLFADEDLLLEGSTEELTLSVDETTLPFGVTFDAMTGTLSGVPTEAGVFTVELTATDTSDETASISFDINVGAGTDGAALFTANIDGGPVLSASTFFGNSIQITNQSANGVGITQVIIDLSDTFIPDTVFDTGVPNAGDATNLPFTLGDQSVGLAGTDFAVSEALPLGNGNNQLILDFNEGAFAVSDVLSFAIDIDPLTATSGFIGGAVAGQELAGGTVTVVFDDGTTATSTIIPDGASPAATAFVQAGQSEAAPTITLGDGTTDARVVNQANLPITIDAGVENANGTAVIYVLDTAFVSEGGLGTPPAPFQGNNAQELATLVEVQLDENGVFNGTVPLSNSGAQAGVAGGNQGINYFAAGIADEDGNVSTLSEPLVVQFDPAADVPPIADPRSTEEILEDLTDVDADGVYADTDVGSAVLTILDGVENAQSSTFGANSYQLTNTGDKQIAAVVIDLQDALLGGSVIDFDGTAGDSLGRPFEIDDGGGTGAFLLGTPVQNLLFQGDAPLPNTTGLGSEDVSGGFRGFLLRFDGSEGGFVNGETVTFSGDQDNNSIAGLPVGLVANGTFFDEGFDVGGVSGAELIGSSFTVLFDDGTTATGFIGSDTSQAGGIGEAVEGRTPSTATLSVDAGATNGVFDSGDVGTYGGDEPVITVTGTAGDTVRVTLQKAFNPVDSDEGAPTSIADLVQARLDDANPEFPVNNIFDLQTIDLVIGPDGTVTVPAGAFDYLGITAGNNIEEFAEQDTSPIALTVAVIVPVTDNTPDVLAGDESVAAGPISDPIFLTNPTETPVGTVVLPTESLIINGDFEDNALGNGAIPFGFFDDIPGFTATQGQIEVQEGDANLSDFDLGGAGNGLVDLASSVNSGIEQTVTVSADQAGTFELSLQHARRNDDPNNGVFQIIIDGVVIDTVTSDVPGAIETFTVEIDLTEGDHTIEFLEVGANDGRGTLIDNVALVSTVPAPPPALEISVDIVEAEIAEGASTDVIVGRTGGDLTAPLTITLTSSDDTEGVLSETTVTFAAGETSATITLDGVLDTEVDGNQPVTVTATAPGAADAEDSVIVLDVDVAPEPLVIDITLDDAAINEGTSTGFTVTRSGGDLSEDLTVALEVDGGDEAAVPATVTILAGETSVTGTVDALLDGVEDGNQIVSVEATAPDADAASAQLEVIDIDTPPVPLEIAIAIEDAAIDEGASTTVTVSRTGGDLTEDLVVTLDAGGSDEVSVPVEITILGGQTSATATIEAVLDGEVDGDQTVAVTASAEGADAVSMLTVVDIDVPPAPLEIAVTLDDAAIDEGETTGITVSRTGGDLMEDLVVTLDIGGSGEIVLPVEITILAGETSATSTVAAIPDGIEDGDQLVTITASAPEADAASVELTVVDIDLPLPPPPPPGTEFIVNGDFEDNALNNGAIPFGFFDEIPGFTATLGQIEVQEGDADLSDFDIGGIGNGLVELAANSNSGIEQTVTIGAGEAGTFELSLQHARRNDDPNNAVFQIIIDGAVVQTVTSTTPGAIQDFSIEIDLDEGDHTIEFLEVGANDGRGTLIDNVSLVSTEPAPPPALAISVDIADAEVAEDGSTTVTVARTGGEVGPLTFTLVASDATEAALSQTTVTLAAGQTSAQVTLSGLLDGEVDGNQTVTITASAPGAPDAQDSVIVVDVDVAPEPLVIDITLDDASVAEGGSTGFTVSRSGGDLTEDLTVTLASSDATEASAPTTVTILAGETSVSGTVDALLDGVEDGDVAVDIIATAPEADPASATLTVIDVDIPPQPLVIDITLDDASVEEGGSTGFTVSREGGDLTEDLVVTLASDDATEASVPATVTILAGQTSVSGTVDALLDGVEDGDVLISITATAPEADATSADLLVVDVDIPPPPLVIDIALDDASVEEGGSTGFTVSRDGGDLSQDLIVTLASDDATEASVPATVTILAGETSVSGTVEALLDGVEDGDQLVTITATAPEADAAGADITVVDIDIPLPPPPPPPPAGIELIVNGDFEDNALDNGSIPFGFFDAIPGWTATVGQIEVQEGDADLSGFDIGGVGNGLIELATNNNVAVEQTVTVAEGEAGIYTLSLQHARRFDDPADAVFQIIIDGELVQTVTSSTPGLVQDLEIDLDLGEGEHTIEFAEIGQNDGRGTLIDNVSLLSTGEASPVAAVAQAVQVSDAADAFVFTQAAAVLDGPNDLEIAESFTAAVVTNPTDQFTDERIGSLFDDMDDGFAFVTVEDGFDVI